MCVCYKYVLCRRDVYFYVASIGVCFIYIYVTGMCVR